MGVTACIYHHYAPFEQEKIKEGGRFIQEMTQSLCLRPQLV